MHTIHIHLTLSAGEPFDLIHISDTHLTLADDRDDDRKLRLAEERSRYFPMAEQMLAETAALYHEKHATVVHTGDLIDFVSFANLDRAKAFTDEVDCFMAAGNHEFSLYVGEAKEDAAYRNQSLDKVQTSFDNNIRFASRIINGVNLIALDNSYYLIDEWQLERLKEEIARGLPILLFMHVPLHSQEFYDFMLEVAGPPAYLMATPDDLRACYSAMRYEQQQPDETTLAAYGCILSAPEIKAVFTGHIHRNFEAMLTNALPQYATGPITTQIIHIH